MRYIWALWPGSAHRGKEPAQLQKRREVLLRFCQQQLAPLQPTELSLYVSDESATCLSPAPKWYDGDELIAHIEYEGAPLDSHERLALESVLIDLGFVVACYEVESSLYRDYGDNRHFAKRDWALGECSPAVIAVTLLSKPARLDLASWTRRWWGGMSPVSERLQPRARYRRNLIVKQHSGALAFDGLVTESWPSEQHIRKPYLFYNASNPLQLVSHLVQMLYVILRFHRLDKIRTVIMSEYFLISKDEPDKAS